MAEKQIIVCEQRLIEKIDANRGDLNRNDFIELCVDSVLEEYTVGGAPQRETPATRMAAAEPPPAPRKEAGEYATNEEFLEFKRGITSLMRSFLEFFVTFGIELGPTRSTADVERLKSQLHSLMEEK